MEGMKHVVDAANIIWLKLREMTFEPLLRKDLFGAILFVTILSIYFYYFDLRKKQRKYERLYYAWEQHSTLNISVNERDSIVSVKSSCSVYREYRSSSRLPNWDSSQNLATYAIETSNTAQRNEYDNLMCVQLRGGSLDMLQRQPDVKLETESSDNFSDGDTDIEADCSASDSCNSLNRPELELETEVTAVSTVKSFPNIQISGALETKVMTTPKL